MPKTLVSVPMPDSRVHWLTTLDCSHWTIAESKIPYGSTWPCAPCDRIAALHRQIDDMEAGAKILREQRSEAREIAINMRHGYVEATDTQMEYPFPWESQREFASHMAAVSHCP